MENVLIVDGMALLFRHYFATAINKHFMRNSEGVPTNGVQGFIRHISQAIHDTEAEHVIVAWDMGSTTFRNDILKSYKTHRPAPPEELGPQFSMVQQLSEQLGFLNIGVNQYEADDVIGTITHHMKGNYKFHVVSGDRDLLQIIEPHVDIWLIKKGFNLYNKYDLNRFIEEYGIRPVQLVDVKAFMGDAADGYPGVKGIGEKTALKLIQTYGSVEATLKNIKHLPKGQQNKIEMFYEDLIVSLDLAKIYQHVPINLEHIESEMRYVIDLDEMARICHQYELKVAEKFVRALK